MPLDDDDLRAILAYLPRVLVSGAAADVSQTIDHLQGLMARVDAAQKAAGHDDTTPPGQSAPGEQSGEGC